ncbi:MAG: hypothetical protein IIX30_05265, partial [Clostridia bacterium]|nr:hypothetical protein [Clostridia bacterium]
MSIDFQNIFPKTELFLLLFRKNNGVFSKNRKVSLYMSVHTDLSARKVFCGAFFQKSDLKPSTQT